MRMWPKKEEASGSDSESEKEESEKESNSDSDSGSESGGSSSSDEKSQDKTAAPTAAPTAEAVPAAPVAPQQAAAADQGKEQTEEDKEIKREEFIAKLRKQLVSIKDPKQRQTKLVAVKGMLEQRADHLLNVAGMSKTDVRALIENLDRDFGSKIKPPAGAPPGFAGKGKPVAAAAAQAETNGAKKVMKSALKGRNGPRQSRRINWTNEGPKQTVVESFRNMGEALWFQMPGAFVSCDQCEKQVPQSCGALQGEPEKPQFAQFQFLCHECMQNSVYQQQMQMTYQNV